MRYARPVLVLLAIGAMANAIVALALDWHANTTVQNVTIVAADEATRLLSVATIQAPTETIAGWRCVGSGIHSVARLVGEKRRTVNVDLQNNQVRFDLGSGAIDDVPPIENGQLLLETRTGWPMRSFVGREIVALTPGQNPKRMAARRVPIQVHASMTAGEAPSIEKLEIPLDLEESSRITSNEKDVEVSMDAPTRDDISIRGHFAVGAQHVQPLPAAANGRWHTKSVAQLFDRDHRVWPLALRPTWPGFLVNSGLYALLVWIGLAAAVVSLRTMRTTRGLCPRCTYDLRGSSHDRCPECGHALSK